MNTVSNSTEVVGTIAVNPAEVEFVMGLANFRYPRKSEAEQLAGWTRFPAIPKLFDWMAHNRKMPTPDEGIAFLMANADKGADTENRMIQRRADKLYLDFCRDMHSMGLLQRADLFGYVQYQKSLDMQFNVDFVAALLSIFGGNNVGIQAAMRAYWGNGIRDDPYELVKRDRRKRRNTVEFTDGPIYWLTNRMRPPAKTIAGCWLFGTGHIEDLAEEIRGDEPDTPQVGIQQELF